jgi:pyruvate/2-oxoglutarate dehydrogenase complex dihydrolipoamide dehydrogenase (E3) component
LLLDDPADRALLAEVHPADWVNPRPKARYHLVVIGAGTGGLVTAAAAAGLGATVALVERQLMGGDCLNVGCVPSKALIASARSWHGAGSSRAAFAGPEAAGPGRFDEAMRRMRAIRARLSPADSAARFRSLGVDVFLGSGTFTGRQAIQVGGDTLAFRRAVIATGARPTIPAIPGLEAAGYYTNETVFAATELPSRLIVIGGGPIGCELAQTFARFGAEVTLVTDIDRVLPRDDARAAAIVAGALARDGVRIVTAATIEQVERVGATRAVTVRVGSERRRIDADRILVAAGRTPNIEAMGLAEAEVAASPTGIAVDDRLRTTNRAIYAVGDVCSASRFTHLADWHARIAVQNALFFGRASTAKLAVPWCTYTSPEVAQVGLTEAEAIARGIAVDSVEVGLDHVDRAVLDGTEEGFCKVVLARGGDRILGATLVSPHAGESISEIAVAMTNRLGLGAIGRTIHPYPTTAEVWRKAADQWRRRKLTPAAQRLLRAWFALVR